MDTSTEKETAAMPEREHTCCFTGYREYKLPWGSDENDPRCRKLQQQIFDAVDAVYADGIRHFICGMANGCDLYFFDAARYLRLSHPEVTIEAAIPFSGQADRWRPELRARYDYDLRQCDYQTLVQETYTTDCMMRRNRYMVDHASPAARRARSNTPHCESSRSSSCRSTAHRSGYDIYQKTRRTIFRSPCSLLGC